MGNNDVSQIIPRALTNVERSALAAGLVAAIPVIVAQNLPEGVTEISIRDCIAAVWEALKKIEKDALDSKLV